MDFRSQTGNLEFHAPMKFATHLGYRTDHPKDAVVSENYWLNSRHMVNAGDIVSVACIRDDATWDKADFEFSVVNEAAVVAEQITDWRHGGAQVVRGLVAVHKGFGKWNVEDESGKVVQKGLSKADALSISGATEEEAVEAA